MILIEITLGTKSDATEMSSVPMKARNVKRCDILKNRTDTAEEVWYIMPWHTSCF